MNLREIDKLVAVHVMGLRPGIDFGTWDEHKWVRDKNGEIADIEMGEYHTGIMCERCSETFESESDEDITVCKVYIPNYTTTLYLTKLVIGKLKEKFIIEIRIETDYVECTLSYEDSNNEDRLFAAVAAEAETMELAICLAALKAYQVQI